MNDRFRFRAWNKQENMYHYDAECAYDSMGGTPALMDDSFGGVIENEDYILEQCTGLKDKNGELIYEGDVVNMYIPYEDKHRKCVVRYVIDEGTAQWLAEYLDGKRHHRSLEFAYDITAEYLDGSYCTVIGNIHDDQFHEVTKMIKKGE